VALRRNCITETAQETLVLNVEEELHLVDQGHTASDLLLILKGKHLLHIAKVIARDPDGHVRVSLSSPGASNQGKRPPGSPT
jgi:hypothetical protein